MPQTYKKEEGSLTAFELPTGIMNTKTKITALATTTLLLVGTAGPSHAAPEKQEPASYVQSVEIPVSAPTVSLTFDKVSVETTHVYVPPTPVVEKAPAVEAPVVSQSAPTAPVAAQQTQTAPTTQTAPVKAATALTAPVAATGSGTGASLLASAYGQIGQVQDCTAMVERALGSVGIVTGDLAPAQFFRFGAVVGTPAPGDILISAGHVGIYAGNGMMISGGFNGNQTVLHPVSYVGGYTAVRVA